MEEELFGGALTIRDNFSSILSRFSSGVSSAGGSFSSFTSKVGAIERANRVSLMNMQNDMKRYTDFYVNQGYSLKQAMGKATASVNNDAPTSGNKWIDVFGKIKQVGTDAFDSIGQRMQSFSNSTLGTLTKLTAGFLSFKTAEEGLKEGFKTGMEYQNLRVVMDSVYQGKEKGGQQFNMATNFAASTIWQERDVVSSLARLKALGLSDSKEKLTEMSDIGSFAKASGVGDIKSATEAYGDMMIGDWVRMTNILGIKRQQIEKFAKDNNMKAFDNKQGQITDQNALDAVFSAYIKKQGLTGLTEKMGNTATGKLSTFKDNLTKSLADLVGITNSGEVRDGSLFDKFTQGLGKFTTKIQEFSESANFTKMSDMLSNLGNSIYSGFSFVLDHPELAGDILKLGLALWTIGKVGALATAVSSIGTLFGEGGLLAGAGAIILPLLPGLALLTGGLLLLSSALSPNGILHQGISWLIDKVFGDGQVKQGWNEFSSWFGGNNQTPSNNTADTSKLTYYGKNGETADNSKIKFYTAADMVKSGDITKNNSNAYNNKTEVNVNIAKVEKTADIDEIGDALVKRIDKHAQTRNNLDD